MQAVILAGGLGTRLATAINRVPKPMAPIGNRPFLAYLLDQLDQQDITQVVLSVGHMHECIVDFFGSKYRSINIQYAIETNPLGTGGALRHALEFNASYPMLSMNGDTYVELNYNDMLQAHSLSGASMSIALKRFERPGRYGSAVVEDDRIVRFESAGSGGPALVNLGIYVFGVDPFLGFDSRRRFSFESDYLAPLVPQLRPYAYVIETEFLDIGTPKDYARAAQTLTTGKLW